MIIQFLGILPFFRQFIVNKAKFVKYALEKAIIKILFNGPYCC